MKQGKMIILDSDAEYGKRLAEYFNASEWMPFQVEFFSDSDGMEVYIKDAMPDLLLVNECLLKEEFREIPLIVLCETLMVAEMDSPQIYKYQNARDIGREVISWYAVQAKRCPLIARQQRLIITGIYSLDRKREKNMLSWEMAKFCEKKGKTLYLNLEPYSGLEQYFGIFQGENLSDFMFFLRRGRGNMGFRLRGITEAIAGVDILPPAKAWEDIRDIGREEWNHLVQVIEEETEYAYLVLDISEAAGDFGFWLGVCDHLIMPVGEDFYSQARKKEMKEFLERRTDKELLDKWIVCSVGGWKSIREFAQEVHPDIEEFLEKLLQ